MVILDQSEVNCCLPGQSPDYESVDSGSKAHSFFMNSTVMTEQVTPWKQLRPVSSIP